jgi:hypothetical protein
MFGKKAEYLIIRFFQGYFDALLKLADCIDCKNAKPGWSCKITLSEEYLESVLELENLLECVRAEFSGVLDKQTFDRFYVLFSELLGPLKEPEKEGYRVLPMALPRSFERHLNIENNLAFYLNNKDPRLGYLLDKIFAVYRSLSGNLYLAYDPHHKNFDKKHAKILDRELKSILNEFKTLMKETS